MSHARTLDRSTVYRLDREQRVSRSVDEVFDFFAQARNLERITPPWLGFTVLGDPGRIRAGTIIEYRLRLHRVPLGWVTRIEDWQAGRLFVDRQLKGPYRLWHHRHEFEAAGDGTIVRDHVRYALPFGAAGRAAHAAFVSRDLRRIFDFRQHAVAALLS